MLPVVFLYDESRCYEKTTQLRKRILTKILLHELLQKLFCEEVLEKVADMNH